MLQILTSPDPMLRRQAVEVESIDTQVRELLREMENTMRAAGGVGLAAPQVGAGIRCIVLALDQRRHRVLQLINPRLTALSSVYRSTEGCLSVPGKTVTVMRWRHARLQALDQNGKAISLTLPAPVCACAQHEIDHLDGKLMTDPGIGWPHQYTATA